MANSKMLKKSHISMTILSLIDAGNFGSIHLARKNGGADNGKLYAVKTIVHDPDFNYAQQHRLCLNELRTLKLVEGIPFFIQMKYATKSRNAYHFVMDFIIDGNLFTHVQTRRLLLNEMKICCAELILAIEYLHKKRIAYRDLKLENILIDTKGHLLLTDFGLVRRIKKNERLQGQAGTLAYFAPEMFTDKGHSFEVDWWSLGIIAFELLVGHTPFSSNSKKISDKLLQQRIQNEQPYLKKLLFLGSEAQIVMNFVQGLLTKSPEQRLGAGSNGYEEVKKHAFFADISWLAVKLKKYNALVNQLPTPSIRFKCSRVVEISLEEPKQRRRKEFYYIAPEYEDLGDIEPFMGFTDADVKNVGDTIPKEESLCSIQLRPDLLITTNKPAEVIKQMVLSKVASEKSTPMVSDDPNSLPMVIDDHEVNDENMPIENENVRRSKRVPKRPRRRYSMDYY